ncbi:DNA starvation/stationary phase protection protein [Leptolyngbya sp. FACHB-711]|uniref:DNA starvation/stationary phase protection protein n=1 Tax=unclassified Leptolyngbya TaxID=2650499 RepID=UPI001683A5FF|nr:DNA starvation/stationary phase protection protein [Cyanobacteria bacterium FACHB-502]MBD2026734.1 DNA starvation/stationary phase protection protein [Leptolyngbya sp. FACHB-711]
MRKINIGLTEEQRQGVIELLNQDLSSTYLLLVKTRKFHWDVVGPQFRSLHQMWDEQYQILTENIDAIAERIRALGGYPIGTAAGFVEKSLIKEEPGQIPLATDMVLRLVDDHEQIIRSLRGHIDQCGDDFHDQGTADFLTAIMEQHEEMAWMLRSFVEGQSLQPDGSVYGDDRMKSAATV